MLAANLEIKSTDTINDEGSMSEAILQQLHDSQALNDSPLALGIAARPHYRTMAYSMAECCAHLANIQHDESVNVHQLKIFSQALGGIDRLSVSEIMHAR
jgi:hypothetical protein